MDGLLHSPQVVRLLDLALEEDLGRGDVTTASVGCRGRAMGRMTCHQPIVCAGLPLLDVLVERAGVLLDIEGAVQDGEPLASGTLLATLSGDAAVILRIERIALNFLMRMCGVATLTAQYVSAVAGTRAKIVDTRKTLPGWRSLDKYAVAMGGGHNHRFDLGSGVLIKDNHIAACGSVSAAVERAKQMAPHCLRIEVEVEALDDLKAALDAHADIVLLDNMSVEQVAEAVDLIAQRAVVEVSGGINLSTARAYAETGVDLISVGALTHSAPGADLSLTLSELFESADSAFV